MRPVPSEPVKPTAVIRGSTTRVAPAPDRRRCREYRRVRRRHPSGAVDRLERRLRGQRMRPVSLDYDGVSAASADAVSPPATENANGKLLEPNTATGPIGTSIRRMSGPGPMGGSLPHGRGSPRGRLPASTASANNLNWYADRVSSPSSRGRGVRPVSAAAGSRPGWARSASRPSARRTQQPGSPGAGVTWPRSECGRWRLPRSPRLPHPQ